MAIRNEMEDFHCKYLSDEQMKELNPIIRNAVFTALYASDHYEDEMWCKKFVDFQYRLIPGYWEKPTLSDNALRLIRGLDRNCDERSIQKEPAYADALAHYCERVLDLAKEALPPEYHYQSLPLCVIDAVFSIGVRYESTRNVVKRYADYFGLPLFSDNRQELISMNDQESISDFVEKMEKHGIEFFTTEIFCNRQRTSSRNGILKTEAVYRFAQTLKAFRVNYLQDVPKVLTDASFEESIRTIPGQSSGTSLTYFFMLSGSENLIKPDRMVLRFINEAIGIAVNLTQAQGLIRDACSILQTQHPCLTPRLLDYLIWEHTSGRAE